MKIALKRVYDPLSVDDGYRILVDRLWPRGISKAQARIDAWLKDLAPSPALRQWFGHDPERWSQFKTRYFEELDHQPAGLAELQRALEAGPVTLLYAAKDTTHNNAVALRDYMQQKTR